MAELHICCVWFLFLDSHVGTKQISNSDQAGTLKTIIRLQNYFIEFFSFQKFRKRESLPFKLTTTCFSTSSFYSRVFHCVGLVAINMSWASDDGDFLSFIGRKTFTEPFESYEFLLFIWSEMAFSLVLVYEIIIVLNGAIRHIHTWNYYFIEELPY